MQSKIRISNWQIIILIMFANLSATFIFVPVEITNIVYQDAWIVVIPATLIASLLVFYPLAKMGMHYPRMTIIQYCDKILGKFFGKIYGLLLIYYFFQVHCWSIREYSLIANVFLKDTPPIVFYVLISFVTVYAVLNGIEVISRSAEVIFPIGIITLITLALLNIREINFNNLQPIMESELLPFSKSVIVVLEWLSTGFVFSILASFVNNSTDLKKIGLKAIGLAGIILTLFSILNILILNAQVLKIVNLPMLALARNTKIPVFERTEILIILTWVTWIFIRSALFSYVTVLSISQLFKLSDFRFLIIPETIFAISYSVYQYDSTVEFSYLTGVAHLYYLSFSLGLPFALWIVWRLRSKPK